MRGASALWVPGALCLAAFVLVLAALGRALRGDWDAAAADALGTVWALSLTGQMLARRTESEAGEAAPKSIEMPDGRRVSVPRDRN